MGLGESDGFFYEVYKDFLFFLLSTLSFCTLLLWCIGGGGFMKCLNDGAEIRGTCSLLDH